MTRARTKKYLINDEERSKCKELIEGSYSPLQHITEISHTVGSLTEISTFDENSDEDENEDGEITHTDTVENSNSNLCVVCLRVRGTTWISCLVNKQVVAEIVVLELKNSDKHVLFVVLNSSKSN